MVQGNYVGVNAAGSAALGNGWWGIAAYNGSTNSRIGTDVDGVNDANEGNVVSGNSQVGIGIDGLTTTGSKIAGNVIGLDASGTSALGNAFQGVYVNGNNTTVGGAQAAARNVISANGNNGIWIRGATGVVVQGNYVGTNAAGTAAFGNGFTGIALTSGAKQNVIGTNGDGVNDATERNVVSGNLLEGVFIGDSGADSNVVAGNFIGTNAAGTAAIGNGGRGVMLARGTKRNIIGTNGDGVNDAAERNIISGNGIDGVDLFDSGTEFNRIAGNYIGTDVTGNSAIGNLLFGVGMANGPQNNFVGTNGDGLGDASEGNVISGNANTGVPLFDANTSGNVIAGNIIGLNAVGTAALPNGGLGVDILNGSNHNRIGTNGDGVSDLLERNTISGNGGIGVRFTGSATGNNVVAGN